MYGTGFFPSEKSDYYSIPEDGLYLVGTSEVPLIAMHMGEILDGLPIRYCAFSSCFRRESGAAGKDTRGMFRVHQFQKVEMVVYIAPEESWDEHERLLALEESLVQEVGLPYRVVNSAAGDLSSAAAKRYDIEAWFPSQERYREITSCSNTTDYQARRSGIRFRVGEKQLVTPHTLNGTAVTDRWALAILENFGGDVPEVLQGFERRRASPSDARRPLRSASVDREPRAAAGRHEDDRGVARRGEIEASLDLRITCAGGVHEPGRDVRDRRSAADDRLTADDRLELRDGVRPLQGRRHWSTLREDETLDLDLQAPVGTEICAPRLDLPRQAATRNAANRVRRQCVRLDDWCERLRVECLAAVAAAEAERRQHERGERNDSSSCEQ